MLSACVAGQHVTVKYVKILSVAQKCLHKFMLPSTMQIIRSSFRRN